jgi:diamine N-acetyltransferase
MELVDVTEDNWQEVVALTTNKKDKHTLLEEFILSNALSIVQAVYERTWVTKAIRHEGALIGFAMYGYCEKENIYEISSIMIDRKYQGHGYGSEAVKTVLDEMKKIEGCREIYLSTDPNNERGIHIYEKMGFVNTGRIVDDEYLFCLKL